MAKEYFSYKKAMEYLDIDSYSALHSLIDAGLPVVKVGNSKKISKASIDEFMKKHEVVSES
ncbi:MAG: helix-turn-helix domain-containing protein [Anaeroplasma bactoclasticum]|nr:helix-turn-helix domain-containing protein [Anaeroplasma bactoclasticum]